MAPDNSIPGNIREFNDLLSGRPADEVIRFFSERYPGRVAFSTSLGLEDQVLTRIISVNDPGMFIFTLDTGRMFPETYDLLDLTRKRYHVNIRTFFPDAREVEQMVESHGINLFYESIENRKLCCHVRKIEPLRRALAGMDVWISGLRRYQSVTRKEAGLVEWDRQNGKIKVNPLIEWSLEDVRDYIREYDIPYNPLHDKGFPSIGCQPCTRAVEPGEDIRAGRWWWEQAEHKECGLHR